jgi:hypothetical protein
MSHFSSVPGYMEPGEIEPGYPGVIAATETVAPINTLPGNILVAADSLFQSGSPSWALDTNASAPVVSPGSYFVGSQSLIWTAVTANDSIIQTGYYHCNPNQGYDFSGFVNTITASHDTYVGVRWYTSASALISTAWGNDNPSAANTWQPFVCAATSPSNAAYFKVVVWCATNVTAGEAFAIDLMYSAATSAQVLVDWFNPSFEVGSSAGLDFMDVTPWVRFDQNLTTTRGRQDAVSEIQAGQATFQLQNDAGWFTPENTTSPVYPNVSLGCRTQINVTDEMGVWNTRFDGGISEVSYTIDTVGGTNVAAVSCSDVMAFMNRQNDMPCWTKAAVMGDNPWMHWTLDDTGTTNLAVETSGNNGPVLRLIGGPATVSWQGGKGGVETLAGAVAVGEPNGSEYWRPGTILPTSEVRGLDSGTVGQTSTPLSSLYWQPRLIAQASQNLYVGNQGSYLSTQISIGGQPMPIACNQVGNNYAVECWFVMDQNILTAANSNYGPYIPLSIGSGRSGGCVTAGIFLNSGQITFVTSLYAQPPSFTGLSYGGWPTQTDYTYPVTMAEETSPLPHHLVMNIQGADGGGIITVYLDNVNLGNVYLPANQIFDTICVGGSYGGYGTFYGNIQLVSIYQYALSPQQITTHCMAGQYGYWEQPTDNIVAALGSYAQIPGYWTNLQANYQGLSLTDYQDATNSTALTMMQLYEQTERGLLLVDSLGRLTFHTRDWRMGYGAPDLAIPAGTYEADLGYELIDTYLLNEAATGTQNFSSGASWANALSSDAYGVYANGTSTSPIQLPLLTNSRAYEQLGLPQFTYWPDPYLDDNAAWQVNTRSQPRLTCGQLTVDLLTLDPTSRLAISDFYELDIDNMVTLTGLPASFPNTPGATDLFIEGINETIGVNQHTISFYTSPASVQRAWKPGDPVYGMLGSTTRIGISAPDISTPPALGKAVAHDAGEPYWPPTFNTSMNNPAANGHDFVGALDIRGLRNNLATALSPPLCVVGAVDHNEPVPPGGGSAGQHIIWDTIYVDTVGGMSAISGWPNWYCVTVPGFYEIDASLVFDARTTSSGVRTGWLIVAQAAAQAIAASNNTVTPQTVDRYVCPIGEQVSSNTYDMNTVMNPITRIYLGIGDMVSLGIANNQGGGVTDDTGTNYGGSSMSLRWVGYNTLGDQQPVSHNAGSGQWPALYSAGYGSLAATTTTTFIGQHTYSYYGSKALYGHAYGLAVTDGGVWQGRQTKSEWTGSEFGYVLFNYNGLTGSGPGIWPTLSGHKINWIQLGINNGSSSYSSGAKLMVGSSTFTSFGAWANPMPGHGTWFDELEVSFERNQTKWFNLPLNYFGSLASVATSIVVGDDSTTNLEYWSSWGTGPHSWQLAINYT